MVKAVAGKVALVTGGSRDIAHALMVRPMKSPAWLPIWPALEAAFVTGASLTIDGGYKRECRHRCDDPRRKLNLFTIV